MQHNDYAYGYGHYEIPKGTNLRAALNHLRHANSAWGTVTIYTNEIILRKFDYNTYKNDQFYYYLSAFDYQ